MQKFCMHPETKMSNFGVSTEEVYIFNKETNKEVKDPSEKSRHLRISCRVSKWNDLMKNAKPHRDQRPLDLEYVNKLASAFSLSVNQKKTIENCGCIVVLNKEDPYTFWIIDGQHRYNAVNHLYRTCDPPIDILFEFEVLVVDNDAEMTAKFKAHYRPADPSGITPTAYNASATLPARASSAPAVLARATNTSRRAAKKAPNVESHPTAIAVIQMLRERYPDRFTDATGNTKRTHMVVEHAVKHVSASPIIDQISVDELFQKIEQINNLYSTWSASELESYGNSGNGFFPAYQKAAASKFFLALDKQWHWVDLLSE